MKITNIKNEEAFWYLRRIITADRYTVGRNFELVYKILSDSDKNFFVRFDDPGMGFDRIQCDIHDQIDRYVIHEPYGEVIPSLYGYIKECPENNILERISLAGTHMIIRFIVPNEDNPSIINNIIRKEKIKKVLEVI